MLLQWVGLGVIECIMQATRRKVDHTSCLFTVSPASFSPLENSLTLTCQIISFFWAETAAKNFCFCLARSTRTFIQNTQTAINHKKTVEGGFVAVIGFHVKSCPLPRNSITVYFRTRLHENNQPSKNQLFQKSQLNNNIIRDLNILRNALTDNI